MIYRIKEKGIITYNLRESRQSSQRRGSLSFGDYTYISSGVQIHSVSLTAKLQNWKISNYHSGNKFFLKPKNYVNIPNKQTPEIL